MIKPQPMTIKELEQLAFQQKCVKYCAVPVKYIPPVKFKVSKANDLTKTILAFIRLTGNYADRINNTGIFDPKTGKFRKSNTRKGIADIMASKRIEHEGRTFAVQVAIEIKVGNDRLSEHQERMRDEIQQKGGVYIVARDWDGFIKDWEAIK